MRKIDEFERVTANAVRLKAIVYYHADWKYFFVRFFIDEQCMHKMTYPADDLNDAIERAEWFVNRS